VLCFHAGILFVCLKHDAHEAVELFSGQQGHLMRLHVLLGHQSVDWPTGWLTWPDRCFEFFELGKYPKLGLSMRVLWISFCVYVFDKV
jgi:hypothetical protein